MNHLWKTDADQLVLYRDSTRRRHQPAPSAVKNSRQGRHRRQNGRCSSQQYQTARQRHAVCRCSLVLAEGHLACRAMQALFGQTLTWLGFLGAKSRALVSVRCARVRLPGIHMLPEG